MQTSHTKFKNKTLLQTVEEYLETIEGQKFPTIEVDIPHDASRRVPSAPMGIWSCMHNLHIQNLQENKKHSIKSNSFPHDLRVEWIREDGHVLIFDAF